MKTITAKLHTVTKNKEINKEINKENAKLLSEIFPLLNKEIKLLKEEYPTATKKVLSKVLKDRLDSKEDIINVGLDFNILGVKIDNKVSVSMGKNLVKFIKNKHITVTQLNKLDLDGVKKLHKQINEKLEISKWTKKLNK